MTAASHSLATALWKARFASGLLMKCYTTSWDTICLDGRQRAAKRFSEGHEKVRAPSGRKT
jgi:hypothetical protein